MIAKSLYVMCGHSHFLVLRLYERSHVDLHLAKLLTEGHHGEILVVKPLELSHGDSKRVAKILDLGHCETRVVKLLGEGHCETHGAKLLEEDLGCLNRVHLEVLKYSSYVHEGLRHVVLGFYDLLMHFDGWSADHWSG